MTCQSCNDNNCQSCKAICNYNPWLYSPYYGLLITIMNVICYGVMVILALYIINKCSAYRAWAFGFLATFFILLLVFRSFPVLNIILLFCYLALISMFYYRCVVLGCQQAQK